MISLNNDNLSLQANAKTNAYELADAANENMWKKALEKNGLYNSLEQFKKINFDNYEIELSNSKLNLQSIASDESDLSGVKVSKRYDFGKVTVSSDGPILNQEKQINNNALSAFKLDANNQIFLTDTFLNKTITLAKTVRTAPNLESMLPNFNWLNTNVLATKVNSSLEVWIRDSSLEGSKLNALLKDIRHSMGSLGVGLSKVSINGKLVFSK
jgi:hypothetical protein